MGDSSRVKAAKARLERAAVAWAEAVGPIATAMLLELQASSRGLRDALAAQGKPA